MTQFKSSQIITSITRWMTVALDSSVWISGEQVKTWRDAILTTMAEIEIREKVINLAQGRQNNSRIDTIGHDRISAAQAEAELKNILVSLEVLGRHALAASDTSERKTILFHTEMAANAAESLTLGVCRPDVISDITEGA
jgi:hypothetical protein